jgi:hypothetical protein
MNKNRIYPVAAVVVLIFALLMNLALTQREASKYKWKSIFNGKNLKNWDIKITGSELNVNYKNCFTVEEGVLKVSYEEFDKFDGEYGHLYYSRPFSFYILHMEYRFTGEQLKGGASWENRNSGVMIHSQSAASMGHDQTFPVSLEFQFLGGLGRGNRTTGNLCTPGTTVEYDGRTILEHEIKSSSETYHGDRWVAIDIIVLADSVITHYVEGQKVLTYHKPKIGGGFVHANYTFEHAGVPDPDYWRGLDGTPLKNGYIALQAESQPVEFRNIEIIDLEKTRRWRNMDLEEIVLSRYR